MTLWRTSIRAQRPHTTTDVAVAIFVTAIVTPLAAFAWVTVFPAGCDLRGDPATYRWTCLLPGLLIMVSVAVALLLTLALAVNRRRARPLPDGWLVVIIATGLFAQTVLYSGYLLTLDPAYRALFLFEVLSIPQPFVAGACSGAIYWGVLHGRRRRP